MNGSNELNIDLEKLLSPISLEMPSGENLRYEGTYDLIQEARREDDESLPQGIWKTKLKKADWNEVSRLCLEALETRSKDLQLTAWLLESWIHLHGYHGIRVGLELITRMCESYWETMHPQVEEDDLEFRLAPLHWINERLGMQLKQIPITNPQSGDGKTYTFADWESALHLESMAERDSRVLKSAEAEGKVTRSKFQGSMMLTSKSHYLQLSRELKVIQEKSVALEKLLGEKCGNKAPNLHQLKETLRSFQLLINQVLSQREDEVVEPEFVEEDTGALEPAMEVAESEEPRARIKGAGIKSRAEAYMMLSEAAEYLIRTEPHSPTPYLVKRAVSWGSMPLTELLAELVGNTDLRNIYTLLGVKEIVDEKSPKKK